MNTRRKELFTMLATITLLSCEQKPSESTTTGSTGENTTIKELKVQEEAKKYVFCSQSEMNATHNKMTHEYNDSIELEYNKLTSSLPQYKDEFDNENAAWKEYQDCVWEVALCDPDHGSSTPMYIDDVLTQGIYLREVSFRALQLHMQGKVYSFCKTLFTADMISDAYSSFVKAVGEDEFLKQKARYQETLRKEEMRWNRWMECRKAVSRKMTKDLKMVYDRCTNLMMRTKLLQLKNQNQTLGVTGHEPLDFILPQDCSDKALLEYPGFDVVWARHEKNPDWFPKFN